MVRAASWLGAALVLAGVVAPASRARAHDMDFALSRLRLADELCGEYGIALPSYATHCKDQELFERLVSEYAVAMAPPASGPARTLGARGFALSLDMTLTGVQAAELYWVRGTEGSQALPPGESVGSNRAPSPVLIWNRLQVRKGLPFGFEAAAALGQGIDTSLWTLGLLLKWALFEGFRSDLGRLPDVAIQAGYSRNVGSSQVDVQLATLDLTLSKPFVIEHTWTVSPLAGVQTLFVDVESGVVDLTPGVTGMDSQKLDPDAFAACAPDPSVDRAAGEEPPDVAPNGQPCREPGGGADFAHSLMFDAVTQTRVRAFAGAQLRYDAFMLQLALHYDLVAPGVAAPTHRFGAQVPRQLAFNVALGAVL